MIQESAHDFESSCNFSNLDGNLQFPGEAAVEVRWGVSPGSALDSKQPEHGCRILYAFLLRNLVKVTIIWVRLHDICVLNNMVLEL